MIEVPVDWALDVVVDNVMEEEVMLETVAPVGKPLPALAVTTMPLITPDGKDAFVPKLMVVEALFQEMVEEVKVVCGATFTTVVFAAILAEPVITIPGRIPVVDEEPMFRYGEEVPIGVAPVIVVAVVFVPPIVKLVKDKPEVVGIVW